MLVNAASRARIYFTCGHDRLTDGVHQLEDIWRIVGYKRYCLTCSRYSVVYNSIPSEMPILEVETLQDAPATTEPSVTTSDTK